MSATERLHALTEFLRERASQEEQSGQYAAAAEDRVICEVVRGVAERHQDAGYSDGCTGCHERYGLPFDFPCVEVEAWLPLASLLLN